MTETYLDGHSLDIVAGNIAKLRSIFPEIVVEDKIDFVRLQAMLGRYIDTQEESYKFDWFGKNDAFRKSQTPSTGTLRPCEVESRDWDTTQNLYIEGDNLEVLKLLQKSYGGRVKMIYIDPPYNKDKDFVYTDKWSDPIKEYKRITGQVDEDGNTTDSSGETEGGRHTKWLNMMYPRLRLAKNLLKDDGVIFISIDDDEVANLKRLCSSSEVFGEENFIAQLVWQNKKGGGNDSSYVAIEHEYILIYARNKNRLADFYESYSKEYLKRYKEEDSIGKFFWDTFKRKSGKQYYPITCPDGTVLQYDEDGNAISWLRSESRFYSDLQSGDVRIVQGKDGWSVHFKQRIPLGKTPRSIFTTETVISDKGTTSTGATDIYDYFKKDVFSNPKPVELIQFLLGFGASNNDIVLDFFSGSGTIAEAVFRNNFQHNERIKYIAVQWPENIDLMISSSSSDARRIASNAISILDDIGRPHIITELAKERIRRAGEKIKTEVEESNAQLKIGEEPKPIPDIGFKVFKLDSSNLEQWNLDVGEDFHQQSKEEQRAYLAEQLGMNLGNFVPDRTELDMVYEVMLKYGLDLTYPVETHVLCGKNVYEIGMGALFITFANQVNEDLAQAIVEKVKELQPDVVRVVAKDLGFVQDQDKTNFKETLKSGVEAYFAQTDSKTAQFEFITI